MRGSLVLRMGLAVVFPSAVVLAAAPVSRSGPYTPMLPQLVAGKELYRQYCEECPVLDPGDAGFGRPTGPAGPCCGPDFDYVHVPYETTVAGVLGDTDGHTRVKAMMNTLQVREVALYLAAATKNNSRVRRQADG